MLHSNLHRNLVYDMGMGNWLIDYFYWRADVLNIVYLPGLLAFNKRSENRQETQINTKGGWKFGGYFLILLYLVFVVPGKFSSDADVSKSLV